MSKIIMSLVLSICITFVIGWVVGLCVLCLLLAYEPSIRKLINRRLGYLMLLLIIGIQFSITVMGSDISFTTHDVLEDTNTKLDTVTNRVSCDSVTTTISTYTVSTKQDVVNTTTLSGIWFHEMFFADTTAQRNPIISKQVNSNITKYDPIAVCKLDTTTNVIILKNKPFKKTSRTYMHNWNIITDTLVTDLQGNECAFFNCVDKTIQKKSIPYTDRSMYLQRIITTKTRYYNNTSHTVLDTTYKNKSPKLYTYEIKSLFNGKRAEWTHDIKQPMYIVSFIDDTTTYIQESIIDAKSTMTTECKDKSSILGKLVYTEFDACMKYAKIDKSYKTHNKICGYSKPSITYKRGSIASRPYSCNSTAQWTFE